MDFEDFFRTYDGGLTWDSFPLPSTPLNGQVRFLNSTHGFLCGGDGLTSGYVLKTINAGASWTLDFADNATYTSFSFRTDNVGYVCGSNGSVIKNSILNSISDINSVAAFIHPNPFQSQFTLPFIESINTQITIYNSVGEKVFSIKCSSEYEVIDLSTLKDGLYLLFIDNGRDLLSQKIIKQN